MNLQCVRRWIEFGMLPSRHITQCKVSTRIFHKYLLLIIQNLEVCEPWTALDGDASVRARLGRGGCRRRQERRGRGGGARVGRHGAGHRAPPHVGIGSREPDLVRHRPHRQSLHRRGFLDDCSRLQLAKVVPKDEAVSASAEHRREGSTSCRSVHTLRCISTRVARHRQSPDRVLMNIKLMDASSHAQVPKPDRSVSSSADTECAVLIYRQGPDVFRVPFESPEPLAGPRIPTSHRARGCSADKQRSVVIHRQRPQGGPSCGMSVLVLVVGTLLCSLGIRHQKHGYILTSS
mmetsp:Transcript_23618/g.50392  ORF Transcript_23618/g.50392 Transcript_23618/m.50392 type:complete len:291 (+) Transcript_23618:1795-2667(+)